MSTLPQYCDKPLTAIEKVDRVAISLKVLVRSDDQTPELLKTDLERLCEERGWQVLEISFEETRYHWSPDQRLKAKNKPGRPSVVDTVDAKQVAHWRAEGRSWSEITALHDTVQLSNGSVLQPSVGTIRRAYRSLLNRKNGKPSPDGPL